MEISEHEKNIFTEVLHDTPAERSYYARSYMKGSQIGYTMESYRYSRKINFLDRVTSSFFEKLSGQLLFVEWAHRFLKHDGVIQ